MAMIGSVEVPKIVVHTSNSFGMENLSMVSVLPMIISEPEGEGNLFVGGDSRTS